MSESFEQEYLAGEDSDATVEIETEGRVFRPFVSVATAICDQAKWRFDGDGVSVCAVDPANIALIDVRAPAEGFQRYDCDEPMLIGYGHTGLRRPLNLARYGKESSDPISVTVETRHTSVEVERPFEFSTLTHGERFGTIDPKSVRQEPDIPDLGLPWRATVDVKALHSVVKHADDNGYDHATVRERDRELVVAAIDKDGSDNDATARFDAPAEGNDGESRAQTLLSLDYLSDIVGALKRGLVETVTIRWGAEFPVIFAFDRQYADSTVYEGEFMLAPRVKKE